MYMSYGEFCKLLNMEQGVDSFSFWLRSHMLPPILMQRVIEKRQKELV